MREPARGRPAVCKFESAATAAHSKFWLAIANPRPAKSPVSLRNGPKCPRGSAVVLPPWQKRVACRGCANARKRRTPSAGALALGRAGLSGGSPALRRSRTLVLHDAFFPLFPLDASSPLVCNGVMFIKRFLAPTLLLFLTGGVLLTTSSVPAADTVRYSPVPNSSKLRMEGTSTIHDWHADTDIIGGSLELQATFPENGATATLTPKVEVKILVRSLKSSGGKRMDAVMQEHMKYAEHKTIEYRVLELTPKSGPGQFDAKGALTVAGVTRTNNMAVTIEKVDTSKLKVTGKIDLKMTDFGISPPAPDIGLGLVKTGNDVKLTFEWVTEPKAE